MPCPWKGAGGLSAFKPIQVAPVSSLCGSVPFSLGGFLRYFNQGFGRGFDPFARICRIACSLVSFDTGRGGGFLFSSVIANNMPHVWGFRPNKPDRSEPKGSACLQYSDHGDDCWGWCELSQKDPENGSTHDAPTAPCSNPGRQARVFLWTRPRDAGFTISDMVSALLGESL